VQTELLLVHQAFQGESMSKLVPQSKTHVEDEGRALSTLRLFKLRIFFWMTSTKGLTPSRNLNSPSSSTAGGVATLAGAGDSSRVVPGDVLSLASFLRARFERATSLLMPEESR